MNRRLKKYWIPILLLSFIIIGSFFAIRATIDFGLHYLKEIMDSVDITDPEIPNDIEPPEIEISDGSSQTESAGPSSTKQNPDSNRPAMKDPDKTPNPSSPPPQGDEPDDSPHETDNPIETPPKKHAIFGYMPVEDQSYLISISNRFTLTEINDIILAYQTGGESWEASKELIRSRVSPEEIEKVRELVYEYIL